MNINKEEKYVGISTVKVLFLNPDRCKLNEILGEEREGEIDYLTEKEIEGEKVKRLKISIWVEETKTKNKYPINFYIYPEKEDTSKTGLYRFINQHGKSLYSQSEETLLDSIKTTPGKIKEPLTYKIGKKGEESFFSFLRAWLKPNVFNAEDSLFPSNWDNFYNGDLSEYNKYLGDFEDNSVMVNFCLNTENDYNYISTKGFCSGNYMPIFRSFNNNFENLSKNSKIGYNSLYDLWKFMEDNFGQYGVTDYALKEEIQVYSSQKKPYFKQRELDPTNAEY